MKSRWIALSFGFLLASGMPLAAMGGPSTSGNSDGDTIPDFVDNCTTIANESQADTDHDGCGDACDVDHLCDINKDGFVDILDFGSWSTAVGSCGGVAAGCPIDADCNGDSFIDILDFGSWSTAAGLGNASTQTGPSGVGSASKTNKVATVQDCEGGSP